MYRRVGLFKSASAEFSYSVQLYRSVSFGALLVMLTRFSWKIATLHYPSSAL
jgi:hypothetical protein